MLATWLLRVFAWDGILPVCVLAIPSIIHWALPNNRGNYRTNCGYPADRCVLCSRGRWLPSYCGQQLLARGSRGSILRFLFSDLCFCVGRLCHDPVAPHSEGCRGRWRLLDFFDSDWFVSPADDGGDVSGPTQTATGSSHILNHSA